jgi:YesN/AraC family two-component response regulator
MEEEKIFTDTNLTLRSLSEILMITTHELSHILNNNYKKNFNSYVNSYRIKEAKKLLLQNPEKSIVEIAYSVGFNAMSSFYSYFVKDTNISPKDYRKKYNPSCSDL